MQKATAHARYKLGYILPISLLHRLQDFVCGGALFCQKVDDLFLVVAV